MTENTEQDENTDSASGVGVERVVMRRDIVDGIGRWLSAALDDPKVCEEMKQDIVAFLKEADTPTVSDYQKVAAILAMDIDVMNKLATKEPDEALNYLRDLHENKEAAIRNPHARYDAMQLLYNASAT